MLPRHLNTSRSKVSVYLAISAHIPSGSRSLDLQTAGACSLSLAAMVLLRLLHTCARLCERVDRWYGEQCLRHELEWLWGELFGPNVPIGHEWRWLHQLPLPTWSEQRIRHDRLPTMKGEEYNIVAGQMRFIGTQGRGGRVAAPTKEGSPPIRYSHSAS